MKIQKFHKTFQRGLEIFQNFHKIFKYFKVKYFIVHPYTLVSAAKVTCYTSALYFFQSNSFNFRELLEYDLHCVPKNDTDVTHYRFNPHQPISVIFGMCLLLENVGGSEQNQSVANVQSDDLWPSRMHAATHILQEKTMPVAY